VFRRAELADLPSIVALLADDALGRGREEPGPPLHPAYTDAFAAIARDPNQLLAVAALDGRVVGTLQLSFLPGLSLRGAWRGEIEGVRVASALRGSGLGREMLLWAIEQCRARGCRLVQLTTNAARTDAQRFYERLGFQRSHVGFKLTL
jgi:ribosomal protein S18 acetylase RimI-like enzyme